MQMRVLEVLDTFYPNIDGPINVMVNIAKILNEGELAEVELLVPNFPKHNVDIEGIKIHRCTSIPAPEGNRAAMPYANNKVKNLIKNGNFDIIHVHSPFTLGKASLTYAKKYNIPSMLTIHTRYKTEFERILRSKSLQRFMNKYINKVINLSDYVLSVSNGAAKQVIEDCDYKKDVYVIRNGTDINPEPISADKIMKCKKEYNLKDEFVFLFVGRLVENKNIQFTLQVLKELKEAGYNDFKFVIVGSGEYLDTLKEIISKYNLTDNVIFTGKIMDRQKLATIYACADLFMFPSSADTCGIVAIEAAANSLPSVMLEDTCASEVIVNGINGFALPNNPTAWKNKLIEVLNDRNQLQDIRDAAKKMVYVSWKTIVEQLYDFYKQAISNKQNMTINSQNDVTSNKTKRTKKLKSKKTKSKSLKSRKN